MLASFLIKFGADFARTESFILQRFHNLMLMLGSKCLHRNTQFHSRITVGAYKLVMIQFDDVALGIGYRCRNSHQLARLIRKQYGEQIQ